jgi:hypothetical protein
MAVLLVGRTAESHFRFGVCDNALAAADFAALLALGLRSTLLADDAAFALVCLVFLFDISSPPPVCRVDKPAPGVVRYG